MSASLLIVDDNTTMRSVVKIYLTGMDVTVLEADSAERALQVLDTARVQLVVADYNMPGMNGIAFIKRVREDARPTVKDIPIVLATAEKAGELWEEAKAAGATDVLVKPMSAHGLRAMVGKCLGIPA